MSYYKAGLGLQVTAPQKQVVGAESGPSMPTMVVAGILSGLALLVISQHMKKAPAVPSANPREAAAHRYVVSRYREKGLPYT